jgi:phage shock protein PspC (stress-responsive transcriptional regulator)
MNKTVTINISGIIFHIEEDAFDKLSKYLATIKGYFSKTDGGNEIMSDIEARIAELLQGKINNSKQVILMMDVDYAMDIMGKPEDFASDAPEKNTQEETNEQHETAYTEAVKKRLYRDPDNKVIGGVCSGVGHYFGFDPVWLRIALALLLVFAGTGVLIYIILWIAIPEANTTSEKLAMKGEKADINNISKIVKEEAEQLKKRMEKYGDDFKNMASNTANAPRNAIEKIVDFMGIVLLGIGRVLLKLVGIFLIVIGVIFLLGLTTSIFGMSFMTNNLKFDEWVDLILLDGKDFYLGLTGLIIFIGIPIGLMIYGGIKIVFKIRYSNRWFNFIAGIVWLIGFILVLYVGIRTGQDFNRVAKVRENFNVAQHDTLVLKMSETPINFDEIDEEEDREGEKVVSADNVHNKHRYGKSTYMIGNHLKEKYLLGYAQLNIIKSQSDNVELVIVKEAKGRDKNIANERAKNISYVVKQVGNEVLFDNLFRVNNADKFRVQDVTAILKLPINTVIYLDKSLENLIYDIENVTNTYDGDMINRRWIMTNSGLKCIDCDGINDESDLEKNITVNDEETNDEVKINVNGVNINAKDAQIKMDSNGVKINSKDAKVTIDKHGVHVKSKKEKQ